MKFKSGLFINLKIVLYLVLLPGNCAVLKPSEISSATAALFEKLIPKYLDKVDMSMILTLQKKEKSIRPLPNLSWDLLVLLEAFSRKSPENTCRYMYIVGCMFLGRMKSKGQRIKLLAIYMTYVTKSLGICNFQ